MNGIKPDGKMTVLAIPNKEVLEIFASAISKWFDNEVQYIDRTELFKAFWADDTEAVTELLCDQMEDTLSYYDAREDFYHAFILGLFTFTGWKVESNKEYGKGRPDIILRDTKNKRAAVIETKRTTSEGELPGKAEEAILQIKTNKYAAPLIRKKGWKVSLWGMAFFQKTCVLKTEVAKLNS
ncbi:MAG: PD-(D/E)XK nuclease domain-containing protein [Desulfovibrionaceae bacterium]|nr:PD-(D/E)XK nuclease domain-containing protein [Desulfovibrionaceae bacterium]